MRWIPWAILLSVCLHISIAAALFHGIKPERLLEAAPMSVAMVQLAAEEAPISEPIMSESAPEPESPEPEPEPIAKIALPKPEKKPEVKKREEKKIVKKKSKPVEKKTQKISEQPLKSVSNQDSQIVKNLNDQKPVNGAPKAQNGPRALNRPNPVYPSRAQQLGTEGTVKVRYDIDEEGRVRNIEILSSTPKNVFEREVKKVMRKWRYEKMPATGYVTTIEFKVTGISQS
ncbi:outer membrane transport energization protein TonB [Xenorhabdus koppenhoeferi]|uniref:Protein TonB n=3 Tax=Xenorhabdus TaxID=626 RepID=A0A1I7JI00_9GAMM|nr:outer membrane transport energization protein TonB [Xenorhabdus koppenhoeferi]